MRVVLSVTDGPNAGREFAFGERDTFLVGRGAGVHFQPDKTDPYFSRFHFLVEVNPPLCRLVDLGSRNGTRVNGLKVQRQDLRDGDLIRAGRTILRVTIEPEPDQPTADWTAPAAPLPVECGAPTIPGYQVVRELGRGGMGVVYLGIREADGAEVAVKTIVPSGAATRKNVDRFLREASILRRLDHANIVPFRDMGVAGGVLYFVMDYVPGTDAEQLVRARGPWSVRSAVRVAGEVLKALQHAHDAGFVHRDVKPANVLLRTGGARAMVMLADFGLARVYQASQLSGLSGDREFGGTPAFMPPEQVTNYRRATPATDQFAAAATLYRLLTGGYIHDFDGRPPVLLVLEGEAVPVQQRRPELPAKLADALHTALNRDPARRFENCAAFAAAIREFAD